MLNYLAPLNFFFKLRHCSPVNQSLLGCQCDDVKGHHKHIWQARNTYMIQENHVAVLPANHISVLCMRLCVSGGSYTQYTYMIGPGAQSHGTPKPCKYFSWQATTSVFEKLPCLLICPFLFNLYISFPPFLSLSYSQRLIPPHLLLFFFHHKVYHHR